MSSVVDLASEEPAPKVQSKDPFPKSAALAMMGARNSAASKTKTPVKSRAKAGTGKAKTPVNKATGSAQKKTKTEAAAKSSGIASVEDTVGSIGDIEDIAKRFLKGGANSAFREEEVSTCRSNLLDWYSKNRRHLPWRGDSYEQVLQSSPGLLETDAKIEESKESKSKKFVTPACSAYGTWVSEIMLQQTRVETVIPYWYRWMEAFPDVRTLSLQTPEAVNALWAGLGYYRRAQSLLKGAQMLVQRHDDKVTKEKTDTSTSTSTSTFTSTPTLALDDSDIFPRTLQGLLMIPGVGPYTGGAIASIAYGTPTPLVDGNVIRVFSRLRVLPMEASGKPMEQHTWQMAGQLTKDITQAGDFNQGLMELGATVCTPTSPSCGTCPLASVCQAKALVAHACDNSTSTNANTNTDSAYSTNNTGSDNTSSTPVLPTDVTHFPIKAAKKRPREVVLSVAVFQTSSSTSTSHLQTSTADTAVEKEKEKEKDAKMEVIEEEGKVFKDMKDMKDTKDTKDTKNTKDIKGGGGGGGVKYLFVRRPASGLLQNQWEFPNRIVWEEKSVTAGEAPPEDKCMVPTPLPLSDNFQKFLQETTLYNYQCGNDNGDNGDNNGNNGNNGNNNKDDGDLFSFMKEKDGEMQTLSEPLVHVFSHQRHTMYVSITPVIAPPNLHNSISVSISSEAAPAAPAPAPTELVAVDSVAVDSEGAGAGAREARWMSMDEIETAGITSGCKKILSAVQDFAKFGNKEQGKKRKSESADEKARKKQEREEAKELKDAKQASQKDKKDKEEKNQKSLMSFFGSSKAGKGGRDKITEVKVDTSITKRAWEI